MYPYDSKKGFKAVVKSYENYLDVYHALNRYQFIQGHPALQSKLLAQKELAHLDFTIPTDKNGHMQLVNLETDDYYEMGQIIKHFINTNQETIGQSEIYTYRAKLQAVSATAAYDIFGALSEGFIGYSMQTVISDGMLVNECFRKNIEAFTNALSEAKTQEEANYLDEMLTEGVLTYNDLSCKIIDFTPEAVKEAVEAHEAAIKAHEDKKGSHVGRLAAQRAAGGAAAAAGGDSGSESDGDDSDSSKGASTAARSFAAREEEKKSTGFLSRFFG